MPRMRDSAIDLPERFQGDPVHRGGMMESPPAPQHPPVLPPYLGPSSTMISSLPAISTSLDGATRQFYRRISVPTRRIALPE